MVLLHNVLTDDTKKFKAFNKSSPFLVRLRCVSELYRNSCCSSGLFWAKSENASDRQCCVCTTWWKCELRARVKRKICKYFRWVSRNCSICASNSESTVRVDLPNFSSMSWRVHLYVDILQFFRLSIFETLFLRNVDDGSPLNDGLNGVGVVGAIERYGGKQDDIRSTDNCYRYYQLEIVIEIWKRNCSTITRIGANVQTTRMLDTSFNAWLNGTVAFIHWRCILQHFMYTALRVTRRMGHFRSISFRFYQLNMLRKKTIINLLSETRILPKDFFHHSILFFSTTDKSIRIETWIQSLSINTVDLIWFVFLII